MNSLYSSWPVRILSACPDGARNMTGRFRGIVSHIAERVEDEGCDLIRIWCGPYQFDLFARAAISQYCGHNIYSNLTAVIGFLRRQQSLINEMRCKCPKISSIRWLSSGLLVHWFEKHRNRIIEYLNEKSPPFRPSLFGV